MEIQIDFECVERHSRICNAKNTSQSRVCRTVERVQDVHPQWLKRTQKMDRWIMAHSVAMTSSSEEVLVHSERREKQCIPFYVLRTRQYNVTFVHCALGTQFFDDFSCQTGSTLRVSTSNENSSICIFVNYYIIFPRGRFLEETATLLDAGLH